MSPELLALLETGSQTGLTLPERLQVEAELLNSGNGEGLSAWRKMTSFVLAEAILPPANVAGFLRSLAGSLDGGVIARAIGLGWNREVRDDTEPTTVPSPGREQVPPTPRTPRRKPVPVGSDLSGVLRKFPGAHSFSEKLGLPRAGQSIIEFIDATGETRRARIAVRKSAKAPVTPRATTPTVKTSVPAQAPTPDPIAAATANSDWKALWALDQNIKNEFVSPEVYDAYKKAEQAGRIRECGPRRN